MNPTTKSSILWNIVDPEDPYDIRKSMIAKLPEHSQNAMSGHLEIVCMMQAAEIERLAEYLDEFRIKFKEVSRKELDRHSYEVLIKELTEKNQYLANFKAESEKLKEFIKKQSVEMEELLRNRTASSGELLELRSKYEGLLNELRLSRENLTVAEQNLQRLNSQYRELRIKYDNLDKKRLSDLTAEREKYQLKVQERIELEVRELNHKHSSTLYQLDSDIKLYKGQIESKNHEITSLMGKNELLRKDLSALEAKLNAGQQNKDQELQELNVVLRQKAQEIEQILYEYQRIESTLTTTQNYLIEVEKDRDHYKQQFQSVTKDREFELENKVALLSSEVERLTYLLSQKNSENQELKSQLSSMEISHQQKEADLKRETYALQDGIKQLEFKLAQKEEKTRSTHEEIHQLNLTLLARNEQIGILESKIKNLQNSSTELSALRVSNADKDAIIQSLQRDRSHAEATLRNDYSQQVEMLKRSLAEERGKLAPLNQQLSILRREKEQISIQVGSVREQQEKILAYEASIPKMSQEIERLTLLLKQKDEYIGNLRNQLNEAHQDLERARVELDRTKRESVSQTKLQLQINRRVEIYEQKSIRLEQSNKDLTENEGRLKARVRELEEEISRLQAENDRVGDQLRFKERELMETNAKAQSKFTLQINELNQAMIVLRNENQRHREERQKLRSTVDTLESNLLTKDRELALFRSQHIREYEENMQKLTKDNDRLRREAEEHRAKAQQLVGQLIESKKEVEEQCMRIYGNQLNEKDHLILTLEHQLKATKEEQGGAEGALRNYKERLLMVSTEMERLTSIMGNKEEELGHFRTEAEVLRQKNEDLKQKNEEISRRVAESGKWEIELANLRLIIKELEEMNQHTLLERDQLFHLSHDLQAQLKSNQSATISKQIEERLTIKHQQQLQELQIQYQGRIRGLESELLEIRRTLSEKASQYETLNIIAHEYQDKVQQLQMQNSQLVTRAHNYEGQLTQTSREIERLNGILRERGSATDMRRQIETLTQSLRLKNEETEEWENKYTKLYYTYQEMSSMHERVKAEYESERTKITEYQQKIATLERQFERINQYLHSMKAEIARLQEENKALRGNNALEEMNRQLSMEIDRLTLLNQQLTVEVSDTRLRLSDQTALEKRVEEYMGLMVILFAEIETLRRRVTETERECEHVRRSSLAPHRIDRASLDRRK